MSVSGDASRLASYQDVKVYGAVTDATPHEVITLMFETVLGRIAQAKGHMQRGEIAAKGEQLGKALGIVEGLVMSLDMERGGQLADNLARLYDYVGRLLLQANLDDDLARLDEASNLIRQLKSGWEEIPVELRA